MKHSVKPMLFGLFAASKFALSPLGTQARHDANRRTAMIALTLHSMQALRASDTTIL